MTLNWTSMTTQERDILIGKTVMGFTCFETEQDITWYNDHHAMGRWNYSRSIKNVFELIDFMAEKGIQSRIEVQEYKSYHCKFYTDEISSLLPYLYAKTLPEAVCIAALNYFGVIITTE